MRFLITGVVPFGRGVCPRGFRGDGSMGVLLDTTILSWEGEIGHGFPPGGEFWHSGYGFLGRRPLSGATGGRVLVLTLDLPSISKFGHTFCPKSVGAVLKAVVFYWEEKLGHVYPWASYFILWFALHIKIWA